MSLIAELDSLINLLEAKIPANPNSPVNQRLEKGLQKELTKYFKALEDAFPYSEVERLYYAYVKESLGAETGNTLDPLLATFRTTLFQQLNNQLLAVYLSGSAEMVTWGKTKAGIPIAYEGPPIEQAITWADKYCAKLVTQMDEETKRRLAKVVSDGIKNKRGVPGLSRDIKKQFTNMSRYRSQMIARTETANTLSQASLDNMMDMGIEGKEWVTGGEPCEICEGNEAEGVISVNQAFSSGHMNPPAHPNAVFEGYGFFPYGSLQQMLRSRYDGPSISIEAERFDDRFQLASGNSAYMSDISHRDILREKELASFNLTAGNRSRGFITIFPQRIQLTIGPNHPVLTRRGFVDAQFLNEGDELLYDIRSEFTASGITPDFEQVHSVEGVFKSIRSLADHIGIPAAKNYFHGDESFCYGEIQVVRPQGNLLPIKNSGIIEHLSKCNLTEAYADTEHVASCGSCQFRFNSIFHSPPCYMCCFRINSIHKTSFSGWAFDASTSTELYNIGGVVVKNCVCALAPARLNK